jgi:hypothetical protein
MDSHKWYSISLQELPRILHGNEVNVTVEQPEVSCSEALGQYHAGLTTLHESDGAAIN